MLILSFVLFIISFLILSIILFIIIKEKVTAKKREKNMLDNINEERKKFKTIAHWYKSILDAVPIPISVTDANACWTFANSHVENFIGMKFDEIKGKPCSNWGAQICNTPNCGIECAKRGIKQTYFTHNGAAYKVDVEILKDINGQTAGYLEVVQDITLIEEMANRQMEAEAVSKAKSSFIATMSHEIRTPLNAIIGITDIQIQDQTISENTKEALIRIHNSGDLLLRIINDILDLSKIEAGKLEITPVNYDVPSLINDIVHLNIMRINSKTVNFILQLNEELPLSLFGDDIRIKQILNNVLSNAFKYTDSGSVTLKIDSQPSQQAEYIFLSFLVTDTGQGMTASEVSNLFNEYSRFNMEANRTTEGTGLGMSITKHLIRLMNGEIYVDSTPGKGTTFKILLPQKKVDSEIIGMERVKNLQNFHYDSSYLLKKSQILRDPMPYGSVLVIDDIETNLYVAEGLLAAYDLNITLAMSGYEAIEIIKNGKFYDIIFMDHMMPKMDGVETTKKIRQMGYKHPIVALTANAVVGQSEIFLKNGFDDYISKPIDIRQLNTTLNKLIRDKQPFEVIEKARKNKSEMLKQSIKITETDNQLSSKIKNVFLRDAKNVLTVLESILNRNFSNNDDLQNYIINIHAIKSALANIGESNISSIASGLEDAGRKNNLNLLLAETPDFLTLLKNVMKKLTPEKNEEIEKLTDASQINFLREELRIIQEACAVLDKKTAKKKLFELDQKIWTQEIKETLDQISSALLHSDFEKAASLAFSLTNIN